MDGWPSKCLFNYDYQIINLSDAEFQFIQACEVNSNERKTVGEILAEIDLDLPGVRSLLNQQLIMLSLP